MLPENIKPLVLSVIQTGAVAVLLEKLRPPVPFVIITGALNLFPAQPVPPMRTGPALPEIMSGAVTVEPQIVIDAAPTAKDSGAVSEAPSKINFPPRSTVTGPVKEPPFVTQIDSPAEIVTEPRLAVVMQGCESGVHAALPELKLMVPAGQAVGEVLAVPGS